MLGICYQNGYNVEQDAVHAYDLFATSAASFDRDSQRHLADCYWNGRGVIEDQEEAVSIYWTAADNGSRWALSILTSLHCQGDLELGIMKRRRRLLDFCIERGCDSCKVSLAKVLQRDCEDESLEEAANAGMTELGMHHLRHGRHIQAFQLFKQASKHDVEANIYVGYCFENGLGVAKNEEEAISMYQKGFGGSESVGKQSEAVAFVLGLGHDESRLFKQTIEMGDENGLARLGLMYCNGRGEDMDFDYALRLLLMAEKKGSTIAGVEIGNAYYFGYRVHVDYISAVAHFRRAFLNGYMPGTVELAHCYFNGNGDEEDVDEAFRLFKEAPDAVCAEGHLYVGRSYCQGRGAIKEFHEAERYFCLAADMGNKAAQNDLGIMHVDRIDFDQNVGEGLRLVRKAARAGDRKALYNMGIYNWNGNFVVQNILKAVRLSTKS